MAYRTVKQPGEAELVIKRSRFIGRCFPVADEQEALRLLEQVRRQHWDATHNCYAYSVGVSGACARYSDDGEPSGTAGLPMMEALRRSGVTDALVVVTRYFGGILLGAGGLVRAYSAAAAAAVRSAGEVEMRECV
ncbi:MAG TPA: YigZ family protein, partial [Candidatus Aphodomorpha intestinavium]|nr:YigZ family protein [Candidatus Aphodomorpha intestinavium]